MFPSKNTNISFKNSSFIWPVVREHLTYIKSGQQFSGIWSVLCLLIDYLGEGQTMPTTTLIA